MEDKFKEYLKQQRKGEIIWIISRYPKYIIKTHLKHANGYDFWGKRDVNIYNYTFMNTLKNTKETKREIIELIFF